MRWLASSAGASGILRWPRTSSRPTSWSMRCADAITWTRIRVNLQHVPVASRPAQEPLDPPGPPDGRPAGSSDRPAATRQRKAR